MPVSEHLPLVLRSRHDIFVLDRPMCTLSVVISVHRSSGKGVTQEMQWYYAQRCHLLLPLTGLPQSPEGSCTTYRLGYSRRSMVGTLALIKSRPTAMRSSITTSLALPLIAADFDSPVVERHVSQQNAGKAK